MYELTSWRPGNHSIWYNPFRAMEELEKSFFGDTAFSHFRVDMRDSGDAYMIEADLPGMKKEDIKIDIDSNYLTISASRQSESEKKEESGNYIRRERSYGAFSRSFDISSVKTEEITAEYTDGVLKLNLPKKDVSVPVTRRLEIK